jgi:hypothetical protein
MFETFGPPPLGKTVKIMLTVWGIFLIPWPLMAMAAGMSSEAALPRTVTNIFVYSVLSYPILLTLSFVYRRKRPHLVWLPALSFIGVFAVSP